MSVDASTVSQHEESATPRPFGRRWRRRDAIVVGAVVVLIVGGALALTQPFSGGSSSSIDNGAATALRRVVQHDLSSQTSVNGTLGYAGSYTIANQAQGTITWLPAVGQIITPGSVLYQVDGKPIVLLVGSVPLYRALSEGATGTDVAQLNADLVAMGYATSAQLDPTSDVFSAATATALKDLQALVGASQTGSLSPGDAVYLPSAARITAVSATLGASAGGQIMTATSTTRVVAVHLSAAQQANVAVGDPVTITLPNNTTTPGVVFAVGSVATTPSGGGSPTIDVTVVPTNAAATGSLDQAPVEVAITTATAKNALIVPVNALLALSGGGYAVETVDAHGSHHLVPVTTGLFDDADGLVQVSGPGLAPGERVVVPSS